MRTTIILAASTLMANSAYADTIAQSLQDNKGRLPGLLIERTNPQGDVLYSIRSSTNNLEQDLKKMLISEPDPDGLSQKKTAQRAAFSYSTDDLSGPKFATKRHRNETREQ